MDFTNVSVLNVGFAETGNPWGGQDISSPFARIYYVTKGHASLCFADKTVEATPGHMYLVPSYVPHHYECAPGIGFYYMFVFAPTLFEQYDFPLEVRANEAAGLLFTNYCTMYPELSLPYASAEEFERHPAFRDYADAYARMPAYAKMQLQGLATIILSYFVKYGEPKLSHLDERLQRVADYVQHNIGRDISLEELASLVCVTRMHLIRLFRKKMGVTPLQYIISKRLQVAQRLLMTTNMSVADIGAASGFNDTSYFIRLFRRALGVTPHAYRDTLR